MYEGKGWNKRVGGEILSLGVYYVVIGKYFRGILVIIVFRLRCFFVRVWRSKIYFNGLIFRI